jgi:hypothetical protein
MTTQFREPNLALTTSEGATVLEAQVQCRLSGRVCHFQVVVVEKGLILRGQTRTYYAKQLAQHAVMETIALPILANEIEVS